MAIRKTSVINAACNTTTSVINAACNTTTSVIHAKQGKDAWKE